MKRCSVAGFVCLYLFLTIQSVPAQTGWQWQYPVPQGNSLHDLEYFSSSTAIAVGAVSTVIMTADGGSSWAVIPNAAGLNETLRSVCMIDALTAIAVGEGGTIIRTTDGGINWTAEASGTSVSLYDVTFTSANTGYAVGGSGTVLKTTDGGADWNPLSSGSGALLFGVSFAHPDIGTVVGSEGTILRTSDGGSNWASQTSGTTKTLNAVQFITVNIGYAVGKNLVLKTTDGGAIWNTLATPDWWNPTLEDLSFVDTDVGFIIGNIDGYDDVEPAIFISTEDGGSSWSSTEPMNHMFGVSRLNFSKGLAVGKMGVIRRTSNGGNTWPVVGGPPPAYNPTFMWGLDFWDIYKGVAVTSTNVSSSFNTPTVLRTADGGDTWAGTQVGVGHGIRLLDSVYADETTVYAVGHGYWAMDMGGVVYRSLDGGANWMELWRCHCWPLNPNCVWSLHGIDFGDASHGVAIGSNGAVLTIGSGGMNQVATGTNVTLSAVSMPDAATVFGVGGGGTILRSTDGGNTWVPQVSGVSVSLNGVHFSNAYIGTVVGNGGTILRTWSGGDEWYPQTSGTTDNLSRVSFSSALVGFIIGRSGTILKTTDGGATWTAELSPTVELTDVHTINQCNLTIVGGHWNILGKRNETVSVFSVALAARSGSTFVQLDWSIDSDGRIQGFHMYRRGGLTVEFARLNHRLIPKESRTFTDQTVRPGTQYEYVLGVVYDDASEVRSNMTAAELPARDIELSQNYPNPFNPVTTIRFSLPETQQVKLIVYDVSGRSVITLVDRIMSFGDHAVVWDTRKPAGHAVSSGVYYYQLVTNKRKITRKMVLIR